MCSRVLCNLQCSYGERLCESPAQQQGERLFLGLCFQLLEAEASWELNSTDTSCSSQETVPLMFRFMIIFHAPVSLRPRLLNTSSALVGQFTHAWAGTACRCSLWTLQSPTWTVTLSLLLLLSHVSQCFWLTAGVHEENTSIYKSGLSRDSRDEASCTQTLAALLFWISSDFQVRHVFVFSHMPVFTLFYQESTQNEHS